MSDESPGARVVLRGSVVSPGVGIGEAYVVDRRSIPVPHTEVEREDVDDEIRRFREALRGTVEQLETIKGRLASGEHRQILKAQQMMLRDPSLHQRVEALIRDEQICAEWAVARAIDDVTTTLGAADAEAFRERAIDVSYLGDRILECLRGEKPQEIAPPAGSVVVAHDLSPADTAELARANVAAVITGAGGRTSHSAIMARSLELPALVGLDREIRDIRSGDPLVVDAIHGLVVVRPAPEELVQWRVEAQRYEEFEDRVQREHGLPAITDDGVHVPMRANVGLTEELSSALFHGAEGVGLYRTEYLYMNTSDAPTEEDHYRRAKEVLQRAAPYPVTFRTFDLGGDKVSELFGLESRREANPAMGLRSLRLALRLRDPFLTQLRGLLRAALHGPLRIMLPLVSGLEELRTGLEAVETAKQQLRDARLAHAEDVPVGIMIEMPSAALVADVLAQHVDFMSVGTNDLIQYTLAIDRENDEVSYLYRPLHPAILRLIRTVAEAGEQAGVPVGLCGEMAADPRYTWVLIGLGISELSMHPSAIPVIKNIIRSSNTEEMRELARGALSSLDASAAERVVIPAMQARFAEHLLHGAGLYEDAPTFGEGEGGGEGEDEVDDEDLGEDFADEPDKWTGPDA